MKARTDWIREPMAILTSICCKPASPAVSPRPYLSVSAKTGEIKILMEIKDITNIKKIDFVLLRWIVIRLGLDCILAPYSAWSRSLAG